MEETYTFSRALHLMRYGGKRMSPVGDDEKIYFVVDNVLKFRYLDYDGIEAASGLPYYHIMGNWEEVK